MIGGMTKRSISIVNLSKEEMSKRPMFASYHAFHLLVLPQMPKPHYGTETKVHNESAKLKFHSIQFLKSDPTKSHCSVSNGYQSRKSVYSNGQKLLHFVTDCDSQFETGTGFC